MADISKETSTFAFEIFQKLREKKVNVFISPLSLGVALAMLTNGANGNSYKELIHALHLNQLESQEHINTAFKSVMKSLSESTGCSLSMANRMYVKEEYEVKADFKSTLKKCYKSDAIEVDFSKNVEVMINEWVARQTKNLIKDVFPTGSFDDLTRLVLVNAIYFKGNWLKKFPKKKNDYFYVKDGYKAEVKMMKIKDKFQYANNSELQCKILGLYYKGKRLVMYVVLPDEKYGVDRLIEALTADKFEAMRSSMVKQEVVVKLPVFKINFRKELIDDLKELKVEEVFKDDEADLSGISHLKGLYLSQVVHQAFVSVDETGTEAVAVTAVGMQNQCARSIILPPVQFIADHPFIFIIFDTKINSVLFIGSFDDPSGGDQSKLFALDSPVMDDCLLAKLRKLKDRVPD